MRMKANDFASYSMSDAEVAIGWQASIFTQANISNMLAEVSENILSLRAEAGILKEEEAKQLAYYQGQRDILKEILGQLEQAGESLKLAIEEEHSLAGASDQTQ